jgi:hypothetical protein
MTSPSMRTPRRWGSAYSWIELLLPVLCLVLGVSGIIRGYHAQQLGKVLAPTAHSGPMTGSQAMAVAAVWCACSLTWIYLTVRNRRP